jgi:hypothetical protein
MIEIPSEDAFIFNDKEKEVIIKGLRLILLVGADHETMIASKLLDILLPSSHK